MKATLIFLLLNLTAASSNAQWLQQNSGTTNELTELFFLNSDIGFVVGQKIIIKTIDGGQTWNESFSGDFDLEGIYFTDSLHGFAIGYDLDNSTSSIIQTSDSGASWTIINLFTKSFLLDIYFVTQEIGFIVGEHGKGFKTKDGGNSWLPLKINKNLNLEAVFFTDTLNGIIVGGLPGSPLILQTKDGGENWSTINSPASEYLRGVYFPTNKIGYIVGWNGTILKTIDGGDSWIAQTSVNTYGNLDVFFISDNIGYVVGGSLNNSGIQKTIDGGKSWMTQIAPVNQGLIGVSFPANETGYCVGANGTILKTTNGGIANSTNVSINRFKLSIYPNPSHEQATIEVNNIDCQDCYVSFYNMQGEHTHIAAFESSKQSINILSFKAGTYFINIRGKNVNLNIPFIKE